MASRFRMKLSLAVCAKQCGREGWSGFRRGESMLRCCWMWRIIRRRRGLCGQRWRSCGGHAADTDLFSCLADKPIGELAQILLRLFDASSGDAARARTTWCWRPRYGMRGRRRWSIGWKLHTSWMCRRKCGESGEALKLAREITPQDGVIVATGSLFLVGEIREMVEREARIA